jgi:HSP20 family molecular chaperone IbpA
MCDENTCNDIGAKHHGFVGMPFMRHFLRGIPAVLDECGPDCSCLPGQHAVKWEGDQATVQIPVPGFGKDEIDVEVKEHFLNVSGHKKGTKVPKAESTPEKSEDKSPSGCCEGFLHGFRGFPGFNNWARDNFEFLVPIPAGADMDGAIKARLEKGILNVTFQKKPEKKLPVE